MSASDQHESMIIQSPYTSCSSGDGPCRAVRVIADVRPPCCAVSGVLIESSTFDEVDGGRRRALERSQVGEDGKKDKSSGVESTEERKAGRPGVGARTSQGGYTRGSAFGVRPSYMKLRRERKPYESWEVDGEDLRRGQGTLPAPSVLDYPLGHPYVSPPILDELDAHPLHTSSCVPAFLLPPRIAPDKLDGSLLSQRPHGREELRA